MLSLRQSFRELVRRVGEDAVPSHVGQRLSLSDIECRAFDSDEGATHTCTQPREEVFELQRLKKKGHFNHGMGRCGRPVWLMDPGKKRVREGARLSCIQWVG